ncbi:MAG TPA: class I tRNA ligase family protein, partial [Sphingobacteriaceae bacterium]
WEVDESLEAVNEQSIAWFRSNFSQTLVQIEENFKQYRLSEALMDIYKLVWDDFCSWYLEMIKPAYQSPIDRATFEATKGFFTDILKLLHPFMPFLTEELWHDELFGDRGEMDCCIVAPYPTATDIDAPLLKDIAVIQSVISEIRNIRNSKQISPKEALPLAIKANSSIAYNQYLSIIAKLANTSEITFVTEKPNGASAFLAGTDEFFVALTQSIDADAERERLTKEIEYLQGFLKSVDAKLSNERFVQNAKADIVDNERRKKADAEAKIAILQESLSAL